MRVHVLDLNGVFFEILGEVVGAEQLMVSGVYKSLFAVLYKCLYGL